MKKISLILVLIVGFFTVNAQKKKPFFCSLPVIVEKEIKPTKNIIVFIADGTSISAYSAARLMKKYRKEGRNLNIDPYICGTVNTFSSNAPIGDSAPTSSCYMTGMTGRAGNISIYPLTDGENDLISLERDSAYQPLATIGEAMRIEQQKSVGMVVTCQFPHATPSDVMAHFDDRSNYPILAQQLAHNQIDVLFGGGTKFITQKMKKHFENTGTVLIQNDRKKFDEFNGNKIWALFGDVQTSFELDRNPEKEPSIAEMTEKALDILSKNKNGFFLMVEGSKIDWSAHANDPVGIISEFIAFDTAFGKALDFAEQDRNTTILVVSDHGNSGFSIGRSNLKKSYSKMSLEDLFGDIAKIKRTSYGLAKILLNTNEENFSSVFKQYTDIELTDKELKTLFNKSKNNKKVAYDKVAYSQTLMQSIIEIFKNRLPFGFTTGGHTGEEVLLSIYNPNNERLMGNVDNSDVHNYLYKISGLKKTMKQITGELFAKHTDVLKDFSYKIEEKKSFEYPILIVDIEGEKVEIPAYSSVVFVDKKPIQLNSVVVYMDKNKTFYLPKNIVNSF